MGRSRRRKEDISRFPPDRKWNLVFDGGEGGRDGCLNIWTSGNKIDDGRGGERGIFLSLSRSLSLSLSPLFAFRQTIPAINSVHRRCATTCCYLRSFFFFFFVIRALFVSLFVHRMREDNILSVTDFYPMYSKRTITLKSISRLFGGEYYYYYYY